MRKTLTEDAELAATAQGLAEAIAAVRDGNVGRGERRVQRTPSPTDAGDAHG